MNNPINKVAVITRLDEKAPAFQVQILENDKPVATYGHISFRVSKDRQLVIVHDGSSGSGHQPYPSIDKTGSVRGMRARGYWGAKDKVIRVLGGCYNVSHQIIDHPLDLLSLRLIQNGMRFDTLAPGETANVVLANAALGFPVK
jgi:hypothetical protein